MELRDYLKLIVKNWLFASIVTFAFTSIGYYTASRSKPVFQSIVTYTITQKPQPSVTDTYTFDNFYVLQSTSLLTDTLIGLVSSPNTVLEVYNAVSLDPPSSDVKRLAKTFRYQKSGGSGSIVSVFITAKTDTEAEKISDALSSYLLKTIKTLQEHDQLSENFNLGASPSATVTTKVNPLQRTIVLGITGLLGSILVIFVREYMK